MTPFRTTFAENIFKQKYAIRPAETWRELAQRVVFAVCSSLLPQDEQDQLVECIYEMKFIPGGRYLYYAGRPAKYYNNCYLLRAEEDTREEWAALAQRAMLCLTVGGGIGVDYSRLRGSGSPLSRTGGVASGPLPLMHVINEIGRNVMQGGTRRSAIYASLNSDHPDAEAFLKAKNWNDQEWLLNKGTWGENLLSYGELKQNNFNFPCPLDTTNISLNYNTEGSLVSPVFRRNVAQAMSTGEPGFSFNIGRENETLRNACTEVVSEDDSDVCNLGSVNLGAIHNIGELEAVVSLAAKFLVCGTLQSDVPYAKIEAVREKNRRLGLGLMGIHEWLLQRGKKYEVDQELRQWLQVYKECSEDGARGLCRALSISAPVAYRAIAPTGSIGILASTTTGIEPLYAVAYKRRYLKPGQRWHYEYVVDATADTIIKETGVDPARIETSRTLAADPERRIRFQADVQDYVDMSISSTINLPAWGSKGNNNVVVERFAATLARYAPRLRGFTCYPDGARGGQPITEVEYKDAVKHKGVVFAESDVCELAGRGGTCGT